MKFRRSRRWLLEIVVLIIFIALGLTFKQIPFWILAFIYATFFIDFGS